MSEILILSLVAIFLGALVRTYFGFGEALISMPLLAIIGLDIHTSISVIGLAGLSVALMNILSDFKGIHYKVLLVMLIGSLFGIPIGIVVLHRFDTGMIQNCLAVFLILYGLYALSKATWLSHLHHLQLKHPIFSGVSGFLSGVLGSIYNSHGVPIVIYATLSPYRIKEFKPTIQAHFLITAVFVIIGQVSGGIWTAQTLPLFFMSLPLLLLAVLLGKYISKRTPHDRFEHWIYIFITLLGIIMLFAK